MNDKGYYHSLKKHIRDLTRPTIPKPSFLSPKYPPGRRPCPPSCGAEAILLNPALSVQGGRHTIPRGQDSGNLRPAGQPDARPRGDLQQTLADYLEAAGLQEAPNDTPLSRTAISKTSQLTDNALHANDISHMMKRRLKDGSLRRPRRPAHHPAL